MNPSPPGRTLSSWPTVGVVFFAIAYAGLYHFGHHPIDLPGWMTSVWPAASLLLAALLRSPRRLWPLLLGVAATIAVTWNRTQHGLGWSTSLIHAAINVAQAGGAAWLIVRVCGPGVTFHRVRDVLVVLLASVLFITLATVLIGIVVLPSLDDQHVILPRARWASHILAVTVITPLVVSWIPEFRRCRNWRWSRLAEAAALGAGTLLTMWLAVGPSGSLGHLFPAPFLAVIPVLVGAIRFGPCGATATMTLAALAVIAAVGSGAGLPPNGDVFDRLAGAQLFLGVTALTGLLLAAHVAEKDDALRQVRDGEARFRALFEHALDAIGAVRDGCLILANPAFMRVLHRRDEAELAGRALADFVAPDDRAHVAAVLATAGATSDRAPPLRLSIVRSDGSAVPVEARFTSFVLADGPVVLVSLHDLTERERGEREGRRVNRTLRTISVCGRAFVHAESETAILAEICRIVTGAGGYRLAWIGYVEHDERKSVRPVANAGFEEGDLRQDQVSWADSPRGRGPVGHCVRSGKPVACRDNQTDPDYAPWRDEAVRRGYRSSLALPLIADGWVFGVLSLYSEQVEDFGPEELMLLQQMADSLAATIRALRARQKQTESEAEVRRLLAEAERGRVALLGILEDERLAEEARLKSDERYRSAVLNSAIGMSLVSTDGCWIEVNPAFCRMLGYTAEELISRPADEVAHPADRAAGVQRRVDLLVGNSEPYVTEKRYLHKSGRIVWVQQSVSLVEAKGSKSPQLFFQTQDITARKLAEESLAAVAERLALALRASKFGVWRYNLQMQITEWDTRMFALFGFPPGAVVPPLQEILGRVAEEDREKVRRSWTPSPACDHVYQMRFRVIWPDGQIRHVDIQGIVHDDAIGRPEWTIGVAGDITDIVQATSESERLRSQLQQARKMETLGNMAAGVAHDFNNLLTGINGFVELASTALPPNHEAAQLLQRAKKGAISARDLVRRILNFARSSNEQTRAIVDVVTVVRDTTPLIVAAVPANISVSIAASVEEATIFADSGQLQQILMNLCTNGAHAIGRRNGRIEIGIASCDVGSPRHPSVPAGCKPGAYVRLWVSDTGCGMDKATQQKIFEPFFTTKKAGEGTGLGLAIVNDIVLAHEGGLDVASVPGCGSTFTLYFPVARRAFPDDAPAPEAMAPIGSGQRILVVDDETSVGMIVRLALQKSGYAPEVYASPNDGWARFSADPRRFELLVIDRNMPEIPGSRFVARAREIAPHLPVILMSGRFEQDHDDIGPCVDRIVALKKPFELADLLAAVASALQASSATARDTPRDA